MLEIVRLKTQSGIPLNHYVQIVDSEHRLAVEKFAEKTNLVVVRVAMYQVWVGNTPTSVHSVAELKKVFGSLSDEDAAIALVTDMDGEIRENDTRYLRNMHEHYKDQWSLYDC